MSRLRSALIAALALSACTAGPAASQSVDRADVLDIETPVLGTTYPVLDLELETASLDQSVRRRDDDEGVRVTLSADVLFAFDSARLGPRARSRINQAADEIRRQRSATITVEGHTDSKGSDAFNDRLSRRRAAAVAAVLERELGAGAPRITVTGKGESQPVVPNTKRSGDDSPRGRARNRRVEIRIPKR